VDLFISSVDSEGNTIDFMLSPYRDLTAAKLSCGLLSIARGKYDRA
jgi:hypothetical protein